MPEIKTDAQGESTRVIGKSVYTSNRAKNYFKMCKNIKATVVVYCGSE